MKRTWKDAAVEVAWKRIKEFSSVFYFNESLRFCFESFLSGDEPLTVCHFPQLENDWSFVFTRNISNFPAFRAAFMKWLDENEVKK